MLRLFAFVTMDGWTTIMYSFVDVDKKHEGRLFSLILIVLGNFLFSNIFIAIIIMQISDATDSFRKTRADEKDIKVSTKQDEVFRRQKLDMRQLLARQRLGVADDFYELGSRFVRRLRHDDLVDSHDILFSPLWMDCLYKAMQRSHHTSNIIMNQHRKMADHLVRLGNVNDEGRFNVRGISRARYNRYYEIKSKLMLIKEQFLTARHVKPVPKCRVKVSGEAGESKSNVRLLPTPSRKTTVKRVPSSQIFTRTRLA
ncbi:Cation channel sperm-associated protein 3 [Orchesella cincta]|uniref:Cation channel sperm-associated protein 3 n=1 Tax=Orchesella cincta TaxID=48709 RepID=A0A1D2MNQ5_ORCCI|nr:Cation channel sperm-associated protein 3 [Orchesella cincta]